MTTLAPSAASRSAIAGPMPRLAPVTMARRPAKRFAIALDARVYDVVGVAHAFTQSQCLGRGGRRLVLEVVGAVRRLAAIVDEHGTVGTRSLGVAHAPGDAQARARCQRVGPEFNRPAHQIDDFV